LQIETIVLRIASFITDQDPDDEVYNNTSDYDVYNGMDAKNGAVIFNDM
jgi:hypothetical protein